jgi:hypothetical protein
MTVSFPCPIVPARQKNRKDPTSLDKPKAVSYEEITFGRAGRPTGPKQACQERQRPKRNLFYGNTFRLDQAGVVWGRKNRESGR